MPEEKKGRETNPLVDENGNFVGKIYPVTWSRPREEAPKPEPIPIGLFLKILLVATASIMALLCAIYLLA